MDADPLAPPAQRQRVTRQDGPAPALELRDEPPPRHKLPVPVGFRLQMDKLPDSLESMLKDYQRSVRKVVLASICKAIWNTGTLVYYPPGAGKTLATLSAVPAWLKVHQSSSGGKQGRVFVIGTRSTLHQWKSEYMQKVMNVIRANYGGQWPAWSGLGALTDDRIWDPKFQPMNPKRGIMRIGNLVVGTPRKLEQEILQRERLGSPLLPPLSAFDANPITSRDMVIVDEAHRFRKRNKRANQIRRTDPEIVREFTSKAGFTICVTATPLVNDLSDLQMAITFLNKTSDWLSDEEELWQRERVEDEKGRLRWRVTLKPRAFLQTFTHSDVNTTVLHTEIDASDFPARLPDKTIEVTMPDAYDVHLRYEEEGGKYFPPRLLQGAETIKDARIRLGLARDSFHSQARQQGNEYKWPAMARYLRESALDRHVVISSFVKKGTKGLYDSMGEVLPNVFHFTNADGAWDATVFDEVERKVKVQNSWVKLRLELTPDREGVVELCMWSGAKAEETTTWFRWPPNQYLLQTETVQKRIPVRKRVLLLRPSAFEGVDLKKTREIHLMESFWNQAKEDQAVARGSRKNSHADLPEQMRNLQVTRWNAVPRDEMRTISERVEVFPAGGQPGQMISVNRKLITADERIDVIRSEKSARMKQFDDQLKEWGAQNRRVLDDWYHAVENDTGLQCVPNPRLPPPWRPPQPPPQPGLPPEGPTLLESLGELLRSARDKAVAAFVAAKAGISDVLRRLWTGDTFDEDEDMGDEDTVEGDDSDEEVYGEEAENSARPMPVVLGDGRGRGGGRGRGRG